MDVSTSDKRNLSSNFQLLSQLYLLFLSNSKGDWSDHITNLDLVGEFCSVTCNSIADIPGSICTDFGYAF